MTYQPNIPTGLVNLDVDYQNIQGNFQQLNTTYGVNHVKFSDIPGNGKHTFVEMRDNTALPVGLAANEGTLYTKTNAGVTDLYYVPDNTINEYQMTRTIAASFGTFGASTGWTYLPGGLLLQWGNVPGSNATTIPVAFPVAFTNPGYSVQIIPERAATSPGTVITVVVTGSLLTNGFTIGNIGGHTMVSWYWMAIGK